jgi:hypothetical protein
MLIECPTCRAHVDAPERGRMSRYIEDADTGQKGGLLYALYECPRCDGPLLSRFELIGPENDERWGRMERLYPVHPLADCLPWMPDTIAHALSEAHRCLYGQAYSASVIMSVQAIEGICRQFEAKSDKLFLALKELREREIIDKKLYEWADELRKHRNFAAHATGTKFTERDAKDIFDFARTICEYVFVLTVRFARFKRRVEARRQSKQKSQR